MATPLVELAPPQLHFPQYPDYDWVMIPLFLAVVAAAAPPPADFPDPDSLDFGNRIELARRDNLLGSVNMMVEMQLEVAVTNEHPGAGKPLCLRSGNVLHAWATNARLTRAEEQLLGSMCLIYISARKAQLNHPNDVSE